MHILYNVFYVNRKIKCSFEIIQDSAGGDWMSIVSRGETGPCLAVPEYINHVSNGYETFTCALPGNDEGKGNHVWFEVENNAILIYGVRDGYCKPETAECRCYPLLNRIFERYPNVPISRIDGYLYLEYDMFGDRNAIFRRDCRCYLNIAIRHGFNFVQMAAPGGLRPGCGGKFEINMGNVREVCENYILFFCIREEEPEQLITLFKS